MDFFIIQRNIHRFQEQLAETSDEDRRRTLLTLLSNEEGKLEQLGKADHSHELHESLQSTPTVDVQRRPTSWSPKDRRVH